MALTLKSRAFADGGAIPRRHTCDGVNLSPPLAWSGVPPGTASLVLVCYDPDAPGGVFRHWAAYNIPSNLAGLDELPPGARDSRFDQARNDFGRIGYGGPCPPKGHEPHAYHFRLSALGGKLTAAPGKAGCLVVIRSAKPLEIEAAEVVGFYGRS